MASRVSAARFVGRDTELAVLLDGVDRAEGGATSVILVGGEAGVGKTRLVGELVARTPESLILWGGCVAVGEGGGLPFAPFVEAFRRVPTLVEDGGIGDIRDIEALRTPATAELGRLIPELGLPSTRPIVTFDRPDWIQSQIFEGVLFLLRRLGEQRPVVLIVEDLHWADSSTRDLTSFLARNARSERLLIVGTYRTDDLHRRHPLRPWLAEMERVSGVRRIEVERFELAELQELLTALLDRAPSPDVVDAIARRTDGNAFFIEELVAAGVDDPDRRLPDTLRDAMMARIADLPDETQHLLGVAAADPRPIDPVRVAQVTGTSEVDVERSLRDALAAQVIVSVPDREEPSFRFRHALLGEALYDDLLPSERRRLHQAYSQQLADAPVPPGAPGASQLAVLAYHATASHQPVLALRAWIGAARAARGAYAFAEACQDYEQALSLWDAVPGDDRPDGVDLPDLQLEAAQCSLIVGRTERAVELSRDAVARIDRVTSPDRYAAAVDGFGRATWIAGRPDQGVEHLRDAVRSLEDYGPTPAHARLLATLAGALMLQGDHVQALPIATAAIEMSIAAGDAYGEANARITLGSALASLGRCEEGIANLRTAMDDVRELGAVDLLKRVYANLGSSLSGCGDDEGAYEVSLEGARRSREVGAWSQYGRFIAANAASSAIDLGHWDEAEALLEEITETELTGVLPLVVATAAGSFYVRRGLLDRARPMLETSRQLIAPLQEAQFTGQIFVASSELALADGSLEEAVAFGLEGYRRVRRTEDVGYAMELLPVIGRASADLVLLAEAHHDPQAAAALLAALDEVLADGTSASAPHHDGDLWPHMWADLSKARAEQARATGEGATEAWTTALSAVDALRRAWPQAYVRFRLAEAILTDRGSRSDAATLLADAHRRALALGAEPLVADIERLAKRSRIEVASDRDDREEPGQAGPAGDGADAFGLTTREREVLVLVAAGMTNKRIGETLFISESTAGVHVSNILGKLGVSTRAEAAAVAARLGLDVDQGLVPSEPA